MLKKILLALVAIVVVFVGVVAMQPADYRVTRTTVLAAAPSDVFPHVNDFHRWEAWSPWAKLDPGMKVTYDGPPAGPGAVYTWTGNKDVDEGRMTLTDSRPGELVKIKLAFIKPFASMSAVDVALEPQGPATKVTWTMSGQNGFVEKAFCLFVSMDKMIGGDFEKGLAQLKAVVETGARTGR